MPLGELINGFYEGLDKASERKYENARRKASLAAMPDQAAELQSQSRLNTARNQSELDLIPAKTQNAMKQLRNESAGLDATSERQQNDFASQANTSLINRILSDHSVNDLPNVIREHRNKRLFSNVDTQMAGIAKLSDLLRMGDKKSVIKFMNDMRRANPDIGFNADVANVTVTDDPNSDDYLFSALDSAGNPLLQMTARQMQTVADMVRPRTKDDFQSVKPGNTLVRIRNGNVDPVFTAPGAATGKPTQLEQNVNFLTSRFGMSDEDALNYLNTSKTVSREQFILKGMQDLIAIGRQPSAADIQNFADLYESTRGTQQTIPASNSGANSNLDPKLKKLLDIP